MATKTKNPDSVVIIENGTWRVKAVLGLGGLTVIVILAFLYRVEAGIVALSIGLAYAGRLGLVGYHQHKVAKFERRRLEAEVSRGEYETEAAKWVAVKAQAEAYFVQTNAGVFQLSGVVVAQFYPAVSASKSLIDLPQLPPPAEIEPNYRRFLDVTWTHLLIVGATNVGKSTLMCHIIENTTARVYIVDPHAAQNRANGLHWPPRTRIIGDGRDWQAVDSFLSEMLAEMNRRYQTTGAAFEPILIVIDEWLSVLRNCPSAENFFEVIGSEARKVKISLVIGTVSRTVADLNVSAAVRDNLTQVMLNRTLRAQNLGQITWSRGDTELVELPGAYHSRPWLMPPTPEPAFAEPEDEPLPELDSGPAAIGPDETKLRILELYQEGKSLHAIHKEVYPGRSYGGVQAAELKAVLAEWGVSL